MEVQNNQTGATGDRAKTSTMLRDAMLRVKNRGERVSIKAVADEVKVHPSLIHHVYPEIAEAIRKIAGRSSREQRDQKHAELVAARVTIRELNDDLQMLLAELTEIASVNLSLQGQVDDLKARLDDKIRTLQRV